MSEIVDYATSPSSCGTLAVLGITAALATGQLAWAVSNQPSYLVADSSSSYSLVEKSLNISGNAIKPDFAAEVANFYSKLMMVQEPLGAEFERVWDENIDSLYET